MASSVNFNGQGEINQKELTSAKQKGKRKPITALMDKINPVIRILIPVVLVIAALICFMQGRNALNNDDYNYYKMHYQACMDGYENSKTLPKLPGNLYKSSSKYLLDKYDELIKDDLAKINGYRARATTFYVSSGVLLAIAVVFMLLNTIVSIRRINFKKAYANTTEMTKNAISPDISPMDGNASVFSEGEAVLPENDLPDNEEPVSDD